MILQSNTMQHIVSIVSAEPTTKTEQLGITMLINDKSQLKRNVEQKRCSACA